MGNRLYVGNLSFHTTPEAVQAAFAAIGEVREVSMPTDRETGQPRGFAFVTMGTAQAAADAIARLDGSMLDGRPLRVNEAQERAPRGGGGGGGFGGGGGGGGGGRGGGGGGGGRGGPRGGGGGRGGGGRERY
jgi:cold-inducible RNA-binding protein